MSEPLMRVGVAIVAVCCVRAVMCLLVAGVLPAALPRAIALPGRVLEQRPPPSRRDLALFAAATLIGGVMSSAVVATAGGLAMLIWVARDILWFRAVVSSPEDRDTADHGFTRRGDGESHRKGQRRLR